MAYVFIGIVIFIIISFFMKSRYYQKIFSDEHYLEVAQWALEMLHAHAAPFTDNQSSTISSAKIALVYTSMVEDGKRAIHFSISQAGRYTTGAVGGRMIYLFIRLLHKNKCESTFYRTESSVYHAVFMVPADMELDLASAETAVEDMKDFQHFPIQSVTLER